jgi:cytochrome c-type biogenesis protein CcmH/NrfG
MAPFCLCAALLLNSYMYLGMALHQLNDFENAIAAYDKAVSLEPSEPLLHLNYGQLLP